MKEPFWSRVRRLAFTAAAAIKRRAKALVLYVLVGTYGPEIAAMIQADREDRWADRL